MNASTVPSFYKTLCNDKFHITENMDKCKTKCKKNQEKLRKIFWILFHLMIILEILENYKDAQSLWTHSIMLSKHSEGRGVIALSNRYVSNLLPIAGIVKV